MTKTDAFENEVLNLSVGRTAAGLTGTHIGLFSAAPTDTTTGTELAIGTGGYARVAITSSFATAPSAGSISNSAVITFPTATADWNGGNSIVAFGIFTAATGGTLLRYGTVTKTIQNGDTASFAVGALTLTED